MSDEAQAHEPRRSGRNLRISLDAMGGDFGPTVTVPGAALALERHPDCEFLLFGREFWTRVINWQALADEGLIAETDLDLFRFVETADEAMEIIDSWADPC